MDTVARALLNLAGALENWRLAMIGQLEEEQKFYEAHQDEWWRDFPYAHVVIKDSTLLGFYPGLSQAFDEGLKAYGLKDFMVRQVKPKTVEEEIEWLKVHKLYDATKGVSYD